MARRQSAALANRDSSATEKKRGAPFGPADESSGGRARQLSMSVCRLSHAHGVMCGAYVRIAAHTGAVNERTVGAFGNGNGSRTEARVLCSSRESLRDLALGSG